MLEADPKNLLGTLGMAVAASAQGNQKEAEKWLQKAAADHPDSVDAQLALAQFYLGTRDFGKAHAVIDAAGKKWPDNAAISNARGLAQMGANDVPGAIASFKQATEQAPKAYGYALNLARAHLVNRDLNGALDVLNGVLKAEPKFVPALALAAAASLQAGQVEKAAGYVERLRQAAPDAPGTSRWRAISPWRRSAIGRRWISTARPAPRARTASWCSRSIARRAGRRAAAREGARGLGRRQPGGCRRRCGPG